MVGLLAASGVRCVGKRRCWHEEVAVCLDRHESTVALKGLDLFAATSVVGLEDVEVSGAPANWRLTKRPDGLRLAPPAKGFMLMICSSSGASARNW